MLNRDRLLFGAILSALLFASSVASVKADAATWAQTYEGEGGDAGYSLVATSDGGYAIAGYTSSTRSDCWLVKTDSAGNMEWNQTYGGASWDYAYSLVETSDGGYAIAGCTHSVSNSIYDDALLIRTDELGNMLWNKTYGTEDYHDGAYALVESSDGGYALAGYRSYSALSGWDLWLVKTDSVGDMMWNKTFWHPGSAADWARSLVETSDGGYAIAGYNDDDDFWLIKTDSLGNIEWNKKYGGEGADEAYSLVATSDGGYAIAGVWNSDRGLGSSGDCWLVKTDSAGNMEWNMTYGGEGNDVGHSLVATSDGGYVIAGTWNYEDWIDIGTGAGVHTGHFWLIKTDVAGNMEWNVTYGGEIVDQAFSVVATSDGGYAIAGGTSSFGAGGYDFWLIKTDENGVAPVIPEAAWVVLPLLVTATVAIFISKKKLGKHRSMEYCGSSGDAVE